MYIELTPEQRAFSKQAYADHRAAKERMKPVEDVLDEAFFKQFDRIFSKEK